MNPLPFDDYNAQREHIFGTALEAVRTAPPIENSRFRMQFSDVDYTGPARFSLAEQKQAMLQGKSLGRTMRGTLNLYDKASGQLLTSQPYRLGSIPYLTDRGTYIRNGSEYVITKQARLKPGVYTRRRESGEVEAHVNVAPGSGYPFKLLLEPETGRFRMMVGQAALPLAGVLKAMGADKQDLMEAWGEELFRLNDRDDPKLEQKLRRHFGRIGDTPDQPVDWAQRLGNMKLDPGVMGKTLNRPVDRVDLPTLLATTRKLLAVHRGEAETDDRDSLAFMTLHDAADYFNERIKQDAGGVLRKALWKITNKGGSLDKLPASMFDEYVDAVMHSALAAPLEEINPLEIHDQNYRVSRMGPGGIPSDDSIPDESRNVQPTHLAFIDPIKTAESGRAGVDLRLARHTAKRGHELLTVMLTPDGKPVPVTPEQLHGSVIAFPNEDFNKPLVRAMAGGRLKYVRPQDVNYIVPVGDNMFSPLSNLIPMVNNSKGHRLMMGAKMLAQAMALREPEAPLVRSALPENPNSSHEEQLAERMGAVRAATDGVVERIDKEKITVAGRGGRRTYELYDNFPLNRKSFLHNEPTVQVGDPVKAGQLLARSNYTDRDGATAIGKNLRVAYVNYDGLNYEDAIVISESAAKALASEHMYTVTSPDDPNVTLGKKAYMSVFPGTYKANQLANMDATGVVKPGTIVQYGDPLILGIGQRAASGASAIYRPHKLTPTDQSITWEYKDPGLVTDAVKSGGNWQVAVKTYKTTEVGDKLSNRYGSKGVVSRVVSDAQMPRGADGEPLDVLLSPLGLISRVNPAQIVEAALGKVAHHTGQPQRMPAFNQGNRVEYALNELDRHGLSDTEDLFDPQRNVPIKNVFTGRSYFLRLHHMAEDKESGRAASGDPGTAYTIDRLPAKGGTTGSKRLSVQDINALMAHGSSEVIRDAHLIKGQRNDDYWRALRLGHTIPTPRGGFVHDKFLASLAAAGINVRKKGNALQIMALTDADIDRISSGPLKNDATVKGNDLEPIDGGLFDLKLTGGHDGRNWSHIELAEPMPNPVTADVVKNLFGLTDVQYRSIIGGQEVNGIRGTTGLRDALAGLNLEREVQRAKEEIRSGKVTKRDKAVKRLGYLTSMQQTGLKPQDLMWTKVPVLPPSFRPIVRLDARRTLATDANGLYRDLFRANDALGKLRGRLDDAQLHDERLGVYRGIEAVVGLGDPIGRRSQQQKLRGVLAQLFGSSPKFGLVQRNLISKPQDLTGRGVIVPDPSLDLDQVGLPTEMVWTSYAPFIVRRLIRSGTSATDAAAYVARRDPVALQALQREMQERPVMISRAPTLHRYSIQAFWPVMTGGTVIRIPPMVTPGFGADFDGDTVGMFIPTSDAARREAIEKMLPSRNLIDSTRFEVTFAPRQEYLYGLAAASGKVGRPGNKSPRVFRSRDDAVSAYRRGELGLRDAIDIRS